MKDYIILYRIIKLKMLLLNLLRRIIMKYVPYLYSLDGELSALKNQSFSSNIVPLINIVKDKKLKNSTKSILDELENSINSKTSNTFFVNIPMNLELTKKSLKKPISRFFKEITLNPLYYINTLKKFDKLSNVIPVIDVAISNYTNGDLKKIRSQLNSQNIAYSFDAKKSNVIIPELSNLIIENDILIYNLHTYGFYQKSIRDEIKQINKLKNINKFKTLVVKQIYTDFTFFKMPNDKITPSDSGYDCIDLDFFDDFSTFEFDYFGDYAGIRNTPIYSGGLSYPSFIALNINDFSHFGFKGIPKDPNSYSSTLLPNILKSTYWNKILTQVHKKPSYGCSQINYFNTLHVPAGKSNPINSPSTWKTLTISHYISMMDYKLKNCLINTH
ncbi:hypothetical protein C7M56_18085 [Clostridium botulinum]|uniref:Uncharacterized protein n=2 Tax=Clostridium botulinum TaxID=1491 RepID=A0ABC8CXQ5_CLOBO|nr:hypothetical protein C7M56_18085 [Clostridium botulinum]